MKKFLFNLLIVGFAASALMPMAMYSGGACSKCKCKVFVSKSLSKTCICGHDVSAHESGKSNSPKIVR